ncbi:uncharacterized protein LACBIDRAFT_331231 [Laccaria bicolor S238N-H82]|uniref:Predicted protein n=1 Tax=Laccaria bicolor (strain S238N-H82 / ATCC MYA-4686) TaxID=486041 RepID=B0DNV3_LACBS|nr:uncharacterized protein LACBIDRAFT_331231 [Laccaria bicolor S238N-H82]EDR03717.1 predicted protein [Laccaria bicolor S238N-H82]|eukprot:XP_001885570.1 predicted protein [Laccaria bicolor S238N-H82]
MLSNSPANVASPATQDHSGVGITNGNTAPTTQSTPSKGTKAWPHPHEPDANGKHPSGGFQGGGISKRPTTQSFAPHIIAHLQAPDATLICISGRDADGGARNDTSSNSLLKYKTKDLVTSLSPLLGSPFNELCCLSGSSSQPRLIQAPQDEAQRLTSKFEQMEQLLEDSGFDSVGEFRSTTQAMSLDSLIQEVFFMRSLLLGLY